jgi:hypothetical protein
MYTSSGNDPYRGRAPSYTFRCADDDLGSNGLYNGRHSARTGDANTDADADADQSSLTIGITFGVVRSDSFLRVRGAGRIRGSSRRPPIGEMNVRGLNRATTPCANFSPSSVMRCAHRSRQIAIRLERTCRRQRALRPTGSAADSVRCGQPDLPRSARPSGTAAIRAAIRNCRDPRGHPELPQIACDAAAIRICRR